MTMWVAQDPYFSNSDFSVYSYPDDVGRTGPILFALAADVIRSFSLYVSLAEETPLTSQVFLISCYEMYWLIPRGSRYSRNKEL